MTPPSDRIEWAAPANVGQTSTEEYARPTSPLQRELEAAINRVSAENGSDTPDFILAALLVKVVAGFDEAVRARERWYGLPHARPGSSASSPSAPEFTAEECEERAKFMGVKADRLTPGLDVRFVYLRAELMLNYLAKRLRADAEGRG